MPDIRAPPNYLERTPPRFARRAPRLNECHTASRSRRCAVAVSGAPVQTPSPSRPASVSDDVHERRGGHPRRPAWITDLEQVARRIEKVQLPAREEAVRAVRELFDLHPPLVEESDRLLPFARREGEGVMQAVVLLRGPMKLLLALAEQDVVAAHVEARHVGVAQPAAIFQTVQVAVEALALVQIVDRDGPVRDAVDLEHVLTSVPQSKTSPRSRGSAR